MRWWWRLGERLTVFGKVFIANGAIVAAGGVLGFYLCSRMARSGDLGAYSIALLVAAGIAAVVAVNYVLLVLAFRPLRQLQGVMGEVLGGRLEARAALAEGDRLAKELAEAFNLVLDRLEEHRRTVSARILSALEDERRRLARELHDETSQALTSLLIQIDLLQRDLPAAAAAGERARQMRRIAADTLDNIHRLIFDLRPTILDDLGLEHAVRWYLNDQVVPAGLRCDLEVRGLPARLPEAVETVCYRIVQEALTNVLRHAEARGVAVRLVGADDAVDIEVSDDGHGFQPDESLLGAGGFGLAGMRERAALAGGRLVVDSAPGRGTSVRARIPVVQGRAA